MSCSSACNQAGSSSLGSRPSALEASPTPAGKRKALFNLNSAGSGAPPGKSSRTEAQQGSLGRSSECSPAAARGGSTAKPAQARAPRELQAAEANCSAQPPRPSAAEKFPEGLLAQLQPTPLDEMVAHDLALAASGDAPPPAGGYMLRLSPSHPWVQQLKSSGQLGAGGSPLLRASSAPAGYLQPESHSRAQPRETGATEPGR